MSRDVAAHTLSNLLHPFAITMATLAIVTGLETDWTQAARWTVLTVSIVVVPALMWLAWRVRAGHTDAQVSIREQRGELYALGVVCIGALSGVLWRFNAPRVVVGCVIAALIAVAVSAATNRCLTKVSIHAGASAGCAATFFVLGHPAWGAVLVAATVALGWARAHLRQHTPLQIALGWAIASVSVVGVFALIP